MHEEGKEREKEKIKRVKGEKKIKEKEKGTTKEREIKKRKEKNTKNLISYYLIKREGVVPARGVVVLWVVCLLNVFGAIYR